MNKKALIIGASSGIGAHLATLLASKGWQVVITGRREHLLNEVATSNAGNISPLVMDISDTGGLEQQLNAAAEVHDSIDLLVIAAAVVKDNNELEFALEAETIAINIAGFTAIADWGYNYFEAQGSGHLVGISSVVGHRGRRFAPAYNASKAYQMNYLEGLQQKATFEQLPIHITDCRPGFVKTAMAPPDGGFWMISPEKAAQLIMKAVNKKAKVTYIPGKWWIIALALKFMPRFMYLRQ